jgi:hypothetical protein
MRDVARFEADASRLSAHRRPVVSKDELRATCTALAQTIHAEMAQLKELERTAEIEKDAPPSTVLNAWRERSVEMAMASRRCRRMRKSENG